MFIQWAIQLVISYVLTQLSKLGQSVDWAKLKADSIASVNSHLPAFLWTFLDPLVSAAFDVLHEAIGDKADLQTVLDKLAAGDWSGALTAVEDFVQKLLHPTAEHASTSASLSAACKDLH